MKWIDKLERKYGKYGGINNLTLYVIICYVIGYIISIVNSGFLTWFTLNPEEDPARRDPAACDLDISAAVQRRRILVLRHRSFSFLYYPIGTSLEHTWGES